MKSGPYDRNSGLFITWYNLTLIKMCLGNLCSVDCFLHFNNSRLNGVPYSNYFNLALSAKMLILANFLNFYIYIKNLG